MPRQVTPYSLSMIPCDGLWRDPYTGKFTLIGLFSSASSADFPMSLVLSIYVALTDGLGTMPVRLEFAHADDAQSPIFSDERVVDFPDPRAVVEMAFPIDGLVLPEPGDYRLKLFVSSEFVFERRISVTKTEISGDRQ